MSNLNDLPDSVATGIERFVDAAKSAFDTDLAAIVMTGSAAEGRMRATSDVNLLVLLKNFDPARADKLREPLRIANAAIELHAMFLLESELPMAMESFAVRFADFAQRHRVLFGSDPFGKVEAPRDAVVRRLKQVLLNQQLRLRERYMLLSLREEQLALALADAAGPLRAAAASILHLEGKDAASPKEALETAVRDMNDAKATAALAQISAAREERLLPPGKAVEAVLAAIDIARRLRERVSALG